MQNKKGHVKVYAATVLSINVNNCSSGDIQKCQLKETTGSLNASQYPSKARTVFCVLLFFPQNLAHTLVK